MPSIALPVSLRGQLLSGTRTFSPASLFSANEPGVWFDPSDLTTLFQDPAGTTPVTAPGNTVGLMLDKSKALALGTDVVVNGSFGTGTTSGWTEIVSGGTITVAAGVVTIDNVAGSGNTGIYQDVTVPANSFVKVTYTAGGTFPRAGFFDGAGFVTARALIDGAGVKSLIVGPITSGVMRIYFVANPGLTGTFSVITSNALAGNHATQGITAARPTYSIEPVGGRRNLLLHSEAFDNAVWIKYQSAVTANAVAAPDGTTTAEKLVPAASVSPGFIYYNGSLAILSIGTVTTASVYVKAAELGFALIANNNNASSVASAACINLSTGALTNQGGSGTYSVVSAGNGWWRVSVTSTSTAAQNSLEVSPLAVAGPYNSYTGNGTSGIYIWGAQIELSATATPYQRVTTQHDVTEAGVASVGYLYFDGVNDAMVTSTITSGTDKAQVFAGVRKVSDATSAVLAEFSANWASNVGAFAFTAPDASGTAQYGIALKGSGSGVYASISPFSAPITNVVTQLYDIGASTISTELAARVNGNSITLSGGTGSAGTGNFLAYPLYIGTRSGGSLPFTGHLYSLITRFGPTLDAPTIASTEVWVAGKTGFYTPIITGVPTIGVS